MEPRIESPVMTLPGAMKALQQLGAVTKHEGLAESTLLLIAMRASQINGCSVCVDMHSRELKAAGEADDALLGSAILAHAAFIPGWVGHRDETANRMRAVRTYARRGPASAEFLAWLDAVEAECETISGRTREALRLIEHGESLLAAGSQHASPDWFTWFSARSPPTARA